MLWIFTLTSSNIIQLNEWKYCLFVVTVGWMGVMPGSNKRQHIKEHKWRSRQLWAGTPKIPTKNWGAAYKYKPLFWHYKRLPRQRLSTACFNTCQSSSPSHSDHFKFKLWCKQQIKANSFTSVYGNGLNNLNTPIPASSLGSYINQLERKSSEESKYYENFLSNEILKDRNENKDLQPSKTLAIYDMNYYSQDQSQDIFNPKPSGPIINSGDYWIILPRKELTLNNAS